MSRQHGLKRMREVWMSIMKRPDCVEITGFDEWCMQAMLKDLEAAIKRYESEARRVRKYYP